MSVYIISLILLQYSWYKDTFFDIPQKINPTYSFSDRITVNTTNCASFVQSSHTKLWEVLMEAIQIPHFLCWRQELTMYAMIAPLNVPNSIKLNIISPNLDLLYKSAERLNSNQLMWLSTAQEINCIHRVRIAMPASEKEWTWDEASHLILNLRF